MRTAKLLLLVLSFILLSCGGSSSDSEPKKTPLLTIAEDSRADSLILMSHPWCTTRMTDEGIEVDLKVEFVNTSKLVASFTFFNEGKQYNQSTDFQWGLENKILTTQYVEDGEVIRETVNYELEEDGAVLTYFPVDESPYTFRECLN